MRGAWTLALRGRRVSGGAVVLPLSSSLSYRTTAREMLPSARVVSVPPMSVSNAAQGRPAYQPFQCLVCHSRFTRHENLKRHAALHSRSQDEAPLPCEFCHATFSRPDLRRRHMKRKHLEHEDRWGRKRRQRDQQSPTQGSDGASDAGSTRADKAASLSPTESQRSLHSHHSNGEGELDMDSAIWHTALRCDQRQSDHHITATTPRGQICPPVHP